MNETTYKVFIDDQLDTRVTNNRTTDTTGLVIDDSWVKFSSFEAFFERFDAPYVNIMSLDHDIGDGYMDGTAFVNELVSYDMDQGGTFLSRDFTMLVHSQNPVARKYMEARVGSYLGFKRNHSGIAYLFVGLPGSGKTTVRKRIQHYNPFAYAISSDDIIQSWYRNDNEGKEYDRFFGDYIGQATSEYQKQFDWAVSNKQVCSVIVDRTNLTANSRRQTLTRLADQFKTLVVFDFHNGPLAKEHDTFAFAKEGNLNPERYSVPQDIWDKMKGGYQPFHVDETLGMAFDKVVVKSPTLGFFTDDEIKDAIVKSFP